MTVKKRKERERKKENIALCYKLPKVKQQKRNGFAMNQLKYQALYGTLVVYKEIIINNNK